MSTTLMAPLFGIALLVGQEGSPASQPEPNKQLKEFEFLVGRWEGTGEMEGVGRYTDEHVYSWNDYHTFLRSAHKVRVGERIVWSDDSVVGWDTDKNRVVLFTFGMDGSIGRSTLVGSRKNEWVFDGTTSSTKAPKVFRLTLTRVDDETVRTAVEVKKGDNYVPVSQTTLKRVLGTPKK